MCVSPLTRKHISIVLYSSLILCYKSHFGTKKANVNVSKHTEQTNLFVLGAVARSRSNSHVALLRYYVDLVDRLREYRLIAPVCLSTRRQCQYKNV